MKTIDITVEDLIKSIQEDKHYVVENHYGCFFRDTRESDNCDDPDKKMIVVNPIILCYENTYRLDVLFSFDDIEKLMIKPLYPGENGEYKGGPYLVDKGELYDFFRKSPKRKN